MRGRLYFTVCVIAAVIIGVPLFSVTGLASVEDAINHGVSYVLGTLAAAYLMPNKEATS